MFSRKRNLKRGQSICGWVWQKITSTSILASLFTLQLFSCNFFSFLQVKHVDWPDYFKFHTFLSCIIIIKWRIKCHSGAFIVARSFIAEKKLYFFLHARMWSWSMIQPNHWPRRLLLDYFHVCPKFTFWFASSVFNWW